jgi:hypothetical protein
MNQPLAQFNDVNVAMLNLPKLSRFQSVQTVLCLDLHNREIDTRPQCLVAQKQITFL